ncbi:unnamed protein product, partial [Porites lobata]
VNSHTEKLSAYVDEFPRPLAHALPSHIRDTTDFIIRLKNLGRDPENSILATLDSVNFLDTKVIKDVQRNISTDIFQKPTDTHPYLHWTSAHPPHLKQSIPYSQALRLRRICSSTRLLEQRILEYSNFFVACGYKRDRPLSEMRKVLSLTQDESLRERERRTTNRIPLVTTYNPRTSYIAEVANRNCHFLQSKERLAHIF